MSSTRIKDLPRLIGQTATLNGWISTTRSSGKIGFAVIRDGTGLVQCVFGKQALDEASWELFGELTLEASVRVTGEVREDKRSPGGVELGVTDVELLGASPDFPISNRPSTVPRA